MFVVGLSLVQRPAIGSLGRWRGLVYPYTFVYFTGTVVYALAERTPDFERLARDLDPAMTLHGVAMAVAGIAFGYSTVRAGVLLPWTGIALGVGVVAVPLTLGLPAERDHPRAERARRERRAEQAHDIGPFGAL